MFFQKKIYMAYIKPMDRTRKVKGRFRKKCEMVNLPIIGHSKKISKNNKLFSERVNKNL
jgi:hypothetical protein